MGARKKGGGRKKQTNGVKRARGRVQPLGSTTNKRRTWGTQNASILVRLELMIHLGLIVIFGVGVHLDAFSLASCAVRRVEVAVPVLLTLFLVVDFLSSVFPFPTHQMKWEVGHCITSLLLGCGLQSRWPFICSHQGVSPGGKDEGAQGVTAAPGVPNSSQILRHASVNSSNVFSGASVQPPSASIMLGTAQAPRLNNRDRKAAARAAQALRLQDTHQTILADLNVISNFFEPDQAIETSLPDFAKTSPAVRSAGANSPKTPPQQAEDLLIITTSDSDETQSEDQEQNSSWVLSKHGKHGHHFSKSTRIKDDSKTSSSTPPLTTDLTSPTEFTTSTTTTTKTENATHHTRTRTDPAGVMSAAFWADHIPALVGEKLAFQELYDFYSQNRRQTTRLHGLPKYSTFRRVRGDGNCAYRAVMFSLIEGAHSAHQPVRKSMGKPLVALRKRLPSWAKHDNGVSSVKAGFKYLQELLENKQGLPLPELMEVCNRQVESDSMVMALRAIAATRMMACEEGRSWAMITRDMELAPKYRHWSVLEVFQNLVLPLAGPNDHDLFTFRQAGEGHVSVLESVLVPGV